MNIVKTVGQAFEVCHKLSSNSPEELDDEQDPLQDLEASSEKDSDTFSELPRKGKNILGSSCRYTILPSYLGRDHCSLKFFCLFGNNFILR